MRDILETLIGIEMEFVVLDKDGQTVNMCDEIPDNGKDNPLHIGRCNTTRKDIMAHYDNVLLEVTIGPFQLQHIHAAIEDLTHRARAWVEKRWNQEYQVLTTPTAMFKNLESEASQTIGCNPSANVYKQQAPVNMSAFSNGLRSCGLHLNIDCPDDAAYRELFIKNLDRMLATEIAKQGSNPGIDHDAEYERRTVYGQAGEHRSYVKEAGDLFTGIEYRVLSPQSIYHIELQSFISQALEATEKGILINQRTSDQTIQNIINTGAK